MKTEREASHGTTCSTAKRRPGCQKVCCSRWATNLLASGSPSPCKRLVHHDVDRPAFSAWVCPRRFCWSLESWKLRGQTSCGASSKHTRKSLAAPQVHAEIRKRRCTFVFVSKCWDRLVRSIDKVPEFRNKVPGSISRGRQFYFAYGGKWPQTGLAP